MRITPSFYKNRGVNSFLEDMVTLWIKDNLSNTVILVKSIQKYLKFPLPLSPMWEKEGMRGGI